MKTITPIVLFFILPLWAPAQQQNLDSLLELRTSLFEEYAKSEASNTAFFGGKSKTDLKTTIASLKEIVKVDNEIMQAIRNLKTSGENTLIEKMAHTQKRLLEVEKELESKSALLGSTSKELSKFKSIYSIEEEYRYKYHLALSLWFLTICFYIGRKFYFKRA